jgi:hypothetical protein
VVGTLPVVGGVDVYVPGGWGAGDLRGDGGVGGAVFQGPRVPVAAVAVCTTAAIGTVEGRRSTGVNSGCAFGGAKSGVCYFLNRQCDISNHVPDVKPKKNPIFFGCWLGSYASSSHIPPAPRADLLIPLTPLDSDNTGNVAYVPPAVLLSLAQCCIYRAASLWRGVLGPICPLSVLRLHYLQLPHILEVC